MKQAIFLFTIFCLLALAHPAIFAQSASAGGNVLRASGFEDEPALLAWDQRSTSNNNLIRQIGQSSAHGGSFIARLGGTPKTTDTLEQAIGAVGAYAQSATLSFYWQVENPRPGSSASDVLYVDLMDANSGQSIPLTTLLGSTAGGWQFVSLPFSPLSVGLFATSDYRLRFEADIRSAASPTAFDLDDVSLTFVPASSTHGPTAELLPPGSDPTLPPPVLDDDGDMQFASTAGRAVSVTGTTAYGHNSDLPNTCSSPFTAHQQITLTATGFSSGMTTSNIKVKFEVQGTTTTTRAAAVSVSPSGGTYTITCTVPNSPTPNQLVTGIIKVKNTSTSEKASTPVYSITSTGAETGFRWGFPDRIASSPTINAGSTTSILGGGVFTITAPGLHVFTKCSGAVVYPVVFAKDTSNPPLKVRINSNGFTNSGNAWTSTWKADGAPVVCTAATPCITTNSPLELDLLNPDNVVTDPSDYNYPSGIYSALKVAVPSAIAFTPPSQVSVNGVTPSTANSVGGTVVSATGSNLTRVKEMRAADQVIAWPNLQTNANGNPAATAAAHPTGAASVHILTADNLTAVSSPGAIAFVCSYQIASAAGTTFQYTWKGSSSVQQNLLTAYTGPGENLTFTLAKYSGNEQLVQAVAAPVYHIIGTDGRQSNQVYFWVTIAGTATHGDTTVYDAVVSHVCTGAVLWAGKLTVEYVGN